MIVNRLFLVDNSLVIIKNLDVKTGFKLSDAYKYIPSVDLYGVEYKDYRMDNDPQIHLDNDGKNIANLGRVQEIENVIDNAASIKANVDDEYFQESLEEAKKIKLSAIIKTAENYVLNGKPLWYIVAVMQEGTPAAEAMRDRALLAKDVYLQMAADINAASTVEEVKAIKIEDYIP